MQRSNLARWLSSATVPCLVSGCFLYPTLDVAPHARPALPESRRARGELVLGEVVDERDGDGAFLGTLSRGASDPSRPFAQRVSQDVRLYDKTVAQWTREALQRELENAGFRMLGPSHARQAAPRLDARIRIFKLSGADESPLAITIALHVEVRVSGAFILKKNYLTEKEKRPGHDFGSDPLNFAELTSAVESATADSTGQAVRDVVSVLECGALVCRE